MAAALDHDGIHDVHKNCGMGWLLLSELEYLQKSKDKSAWRSDKHRVSMVNLK